MPPADQRTRENLPFDPADHLLPPGRKSSAGPTIGIVVIVILLVFGALYFWGAQLDRKDQNPPPYIPADSTSGAQ